MKKKKRSRGNLLQKDLTRFAWWPVFCRSSLLPLCLCVSCSAEGDIMGWFVLIIRFYMNFTDANFSYDVLSFLLSTDVLNTIETFTCNQSDGF